MHPVWIMLVGVAIVLGGILLLRVHAFLALTLAALAVAVLTPQSELERFWIDSQRIPILSVNGDHWRLDAAAKSGLRPGSRLVVLALPRGKPALEVGMLEVVGFETTTEGSVCLARPLGGAELAGGQNHWAVIDPLKLVSARNQARDNVGERVAAAFGDTCGKIGILIAMAAIIGKCLLDSGAADRIVRAALNILGEGGAAVAFLLSGFLLGIPVFFDTVFYLMMPLGKAMRMRTGRNYLLYILTIVAGATMAHSLVPPTPGPLLVAEALDVDLGLMVLGGCVVGLFSSTSGYLFAQWANRHSEVPLRESPDLSFAELEALTKRKTHELPPLWLSLLPVVLPVVLIAGYTIIKVIGVQGDWLPLAATLGNKNIALTIATLIAIGMLVWQKRTRLADLATSIQAALASGGVIILITSAGGAFGAMLEQTGVASLIGKPQGSPQLVILLAFLITAAIRTAQGSATVAMITAVGVLAGFASSDMGCHPLYLALAIGCGSKPVSWMNDSGFWVICKISGMTEAEGLRFVSPMSILMGVVGLIVTLALSAAIPLV